MQKTPLLVEKKNSLHKSTFVVRDRIVGARDFTLIAGPCSVESKAQILEMAAALKEMGAHWLRGGAFKPRTSPYSFQGLKSKGLEYLKEASERYGLPVISEIMSETQIPAALECCDVLQVGSRNCQNFRLLEALSELRKPIFLKRGFGVTVAEYLHSAEYLLKGGNEQVILCERGIRTFETSTRFTFDVNSLIVLQEKSHLPVFADPSHATGVARYVPRVAKAAIAAGADGLMLEVHHSPDKALSDGNQSLSFKEFSAFMDEIRPFISAAGRSLEP